MKLYTKSGDDGSTGLFGGQRVAKCGLRVAAYGEVDEANAAIGVAVATCSDQQIKDRIAEIQADLFVVGAELATPAGHKPPNSISASDVARLERWIDEASEETAPLRTFVLPGGTPLAGGLHFARTVCRRAERAVVKLLEEDEVSGLIIVYLNRLSDLLFAWARLANHRSKVADVPWNPPRT